MEEGNRMSQRCETCRFWKLIEEEYGVCRRYPPKVFEDTIARDTYSAWPDTTKTAWCGEYSFQMKGKKKTDE